VLFGVFRKFLRENKPASAGAILEGMGMFFVVTISSVAVGWVFAAFSAILMKNVNFKDAPAAEIILVIIFGFCSYYVTEAAGLSGIMALFIAGRTMGHYTWHNLSMESKIILPTMLHAFALVAETYIFSFLGVAFWAFEHNWGQIFGFTLLVLLILLFARGVTLFPMVGTARRRGTEGGQPRQADVRR